MKVFEPASFPESEKRSKVVTAATNGTEYRPVTSFTREEKLRRATAYANTMDPAIEGSNGEARTYRAACSVGHDFDLSTEDTLEALREWNSRCSPPWSEPELRTKAENAAAYAQQPRGWRLPVQRPARNGHHAHGGVTPAQDGSIEREPPDGSTLSSLEPEVPAQAISGEVAEALILDASNPMPSARAFVNQFHIVSDTRALQHQSGVFFEFQQEANAYAEVDEAAIRATLYTWLESARCWSKPKGDSEEQALVPFKPSKTKVENVLDALRAVCNLPASKAAPCWIVESEINPLDIVACQNGLLHLPSRRLLQSTARFFTVNGINFAFERNAAKPAEWLKFLSQLWADDPQSIETLQEWLGYLLTPRTHFQKMLMLVGPKRSGKGTIGRVTRMLLGDRNVCGPTLGNMGEQFGLSILIGKSAAIVADARISGRTDTSVITERLLSISGEDTLSIPRKFLPDWNGKLPTRFTLMTNELPRIEDSSGALASRFIVLTLNESFYGREDHGLLDRFIPELPGILLWALDGLERLQARGRFLQPESAAEMIREFEDLGSPIGAFLRDRCEVGRGYEVSADTLFDTWKNWCEENGRERAGTVQGFGRNLRSAVPWLKMTQPRVLGSRIRYYEGLRLQEGGTR